MAKKASVTLEVLLKSAGIKATTQQVEKLQSELKELATEQADVATKTKKAAKATDKYAKSTKNLTKEQNKSVRAHKGAAEATGRQGKDFSRMAQGMGGLVQIYATIVGNVYALSTAFLVLRNAADLSSMIKSAEDFSNRFGRSVTTITKDIQKATGGALSFAEALPNINKAISAGFSTEKITKLSQAATLASQTFGGTANEALGRFISAAQRGRTEIVQTLGIVLQTEKVYANYAASIGKTKDELNAFDKQVAISNAIIEESQNVFDGVKIDPNPFTQFATTVADMKDNILTFITDGLTPLVNLMNKSKAVALAFMGAVAGMITKKLLPAVNEMTQAAAQAGIASSRQAKKAAIAAREAATVAATEAAKTRKGFIGRSDKAEEKALRTKYQKHLSMHNAFNQSIYDADGKLNVKRLSLQKAAIAREAKLRREGVTKGRLTAFKGMDDKVFFKLESFYSRVGAGAFKTAKANKQAKIAVDNLSTSMGVLGARGVAAYQRLNANVIGFKSQVKSGFASVFRSAQDDFPKALRKTGNTYKRFFEGIITGNATAGQSFKKLGTVVGKTAGLMAGAFTRLANHLGIIMLVVTAGIALWNKYGDAIRGITPEVRKFIDIQKELPGRLDEIKTRTNEYLENLEGKTPKTLKELSSALDFTTGSFMSINEELNKFTASMKEAMGAQTVGEAQSNLTNLKSKLKELQKAQNEAYARSSRSGGTDETANRQFAQLGIEIKKVKKEIKAVDTALKNVGENVNLDTLVSAFGSVTQQALVSGIDKEAISRVINKTFSGVTGFDNLSDNIKQSITDALTSGDIDEAVNIIEKNLGKGFGKNLDPKAIEQTGKAVKDAAAQFAGMAGTLNTNVKSVQQLETDTARYFQTFERSLFSSGGASKEFNNLALNIRNNLEALGKSAEDSELARDIIGDPTQLAAIKQFLGVRKDATIEFNELQKRAKDLIEEILTIEREAIRIEQEKKLVKEQQREVEARIGNTADKRLTNLKDQQRLIIKNLDLEKQALANAKQSAILELRKTANTLATAQGDEREALLGQIAAQRNIIALLNQQEITLSTIIDSTEKRQRVEKAVASIQERKRPLAAEEAKIQGDIYLLKNKIIRSDSQALSNLKQRNKYERDSADNKVKLAALDLLEVRRKKTIGEATAADVQEARNKLAAAEQYRDQLTETQTIEENLLNISFVRRDVATALTVAQQAQAVINASIVRSDADSLTKLAEKHKIQEDTLVLQIQQLALTKAAIILEERNENIKRAKLLAINAEIDAALQLLGITKENNQVARDKAPLDILDRTLSNRLSILKLEKETLDLRKQLTYSTRNTAQAYKETLNNLDAQYSIERAKLEVAKSSISVAERNTDEGQRQLNLLNAQIKKLEAKYEIEREIAELNVRSSSLESKPTGLFSGLLSKEGIDIAFKYFELKARQAANATIPLFKAIGDGFYDSITSTFKTAVDNLLEGGKDFAYNIREAFKAGLREMFSKAIMNAATQNFSIIAKNISKFTSGLVGSKSKETNRENLENQQSELQATIQDLKDSQGNIELKDNASRFTINFLPRIAKAVETMAASLGISGEDLGTTLSLGQPLQTALQSPVQQPQTFAQSMGISSTIAPQQSSNSEVVKELKKGNTIAEQPIDLNNENITKINESPNVLAGLGIVGSIISASQGDSKAAIVQALFAIAAQIIASQQAAATAAASTSLLASGGIVKGGTSSLLPLASGGVVTQPSVALIGEGKNNEAVVPLPNNREIPVQLMGNQGDTINIEQTFDFRNANQDTVNQLKAEARLIEDRTFNRVFTEINKGGKYAKLSGRR